MVQVDWVSRSTLTEVVLLLVAFVLSAIVGLERQRQLKSAGLRTHTLVGLGAATFTLVSSYGFHNVLGDEVVADPTRIAAQIVSGIGFLGAGLIFVRHQTVNGLTTAASVWVVAAIGMAAGAGMPLLAALTTVLHLAAVTVLARVARWFPTAGPGRALVVTYADGRGALRSILAEATELGYSVTLDATTRREQHGRTPNIEAHLRFDRGKANLSELVNGLQGVAGVEQVRATARLE